MLNYLWIAFCRMRRRKQNGMAQCSLEWPDIDSFMRRTGTLLTDWDLSVIEELDDLFMSTKSQKQEAE